MNISDYASLATQYATNKTISDVSTAMLSKTMDMQKVEGAGLVKMMDASAAAMELSVNPHIGGNFDMSV